MVEVQGKEKGKKAGAFKPGNKGGKNQGPKDGFKKAGEKRGVKRKVPSNGSKQPQASDKEPAAASGQSQDVKGPANKKRRARLERARSRPNFDMVSRAKTIWSTFRTKRMDKEEREKMSEELFQLIQGKLHQLAVKHDAARVVQCALKHGTPEQRAVYFKELLEHVLEFSKVQYSHFIVLRLLDVCSSPPERKLVIRALSNQAAVLCTHAVGAKVMDALFTSYPREDARVLRMELYGKEAMLLLPKRPGGYDLKAVLEELPERRASVLAHVAKVIQRMVVKGLAGLVFVQELIWEYLTCCGPKLISEMVLHLTDVILLLTGTRAGAKVLSECAAYGSVKERKKMLKTLKGYVVPTLFHKDAYLFVLRLADVVDDTVAFNKTVWPELLGKKDGEEAAADEGGVPLLLQLATHPKAYKVLLNLLAPHKNKTFLAKDELALLEPALLPPSAVSAKEAKEKEASEAANGKEGKAAAKDEEEGEGGKAAVAMVVEEDEDRSTWVPTSKKGADVRREELLAPLKGPLVALCKEHAVTLLCSQEGSFVLFEVAKKWKDPELLLALAEVAAEAEFGEEEEEEEAGEEEDGEAMDVDAGEDEDEAEDEAAAKGEEGTKAKAAKEAPQPVEEGLVREHPVAYKTIKRLILSEEKDDEPIFSQAVYEAARADWMAWLGTMRSGFLIEALAKVQAVRTKLLAELASGHRQELQEAATDKGLKGPAALLEMIQKEEGGKPQKQPAGKPQKQQQPNKKGGGGGGGGKKKK